MREILYYLDCAKRRADMTAKATGATASDDPDDPYTAAAEEAVFSPEFALP